MFIKIFLGEYSARGARGASSTRGARGGSGRGRGRGGISSQSIATPHSLNATQSTQSNTETWDTEPLDSWDAPLASSSEIFDSQETPSILQTSDDWATDDFTKENQIVAATATVISTSLNSNVNSTSKPVAPKIAPSSWAALVKR